MIQFKYEERIKNHMLRFNLSKKIKVFLLTIFIISAIFNTLIILNGGNIEENLLYAIILIFSPALVGLIVEFIFEKDIKDFGWKWKNNKLHLISYLTPILYLGISYGIVKLFNLYEFNSQEIEQLGVLGLLMIPTLGITGALLPVIGEEIGWRGFLFNNLRKNHSFMKSSMITGIVWAVFHYPLLLLGNYNNSVTPFWFSIICFTISILGANTMINLLFEKSGSLWTAVIFHTVHNSILNDLEALILHSEISPFLLTEFGAVVALMISIFTIYCLNSYRPGSTT